MGQLSLKWRERWSIRRGKEECGGKKLVGIARGKLFKNPAAQRIGGPERTGCYRGPLPSGKDVVGQTKS